MKPSVLEKRTCLISEWKLIWFNILILLKIPSWANVYLILQANKNSIPILSLVTYCDNDLEKRTIIENQ